MKEQATHSEIKKAYYRRAKEYHPDLHLNLPGEMKEKLLEIFTYITNAYLTLTNPVERNDYDRCIQHYREKSTTASEERMQPSVFERDLQKKEYDDCIQRNQGRIATNSEIALSRFKEGKNKFRNKRFRDSAHLFALAIYFDRLIPEYHFFYGYALEMLGDLKEAAKALNRALELKPNDASILAELGHVYLKLGFSLRAKGYFDKARKLAPAHKRVLEGLEILKHS